MEQKHNADLSIEDRAEIFHEDYGNEADPGVTLARLVRGAGDYLEIVVGPEVTAPAMAGIARTLGWEGPSEEWRQGLADNEFMCFSEWPLGQELHALVAYAIYGIVLEAPEEESREETERYVAETVRKAEDFLHRSPLERWGLNERPSELEQIVMLASNRWALDNMKPVEPAALAFFGGLSEGRVRNMMSGAKAVFTNKGGKILATEALAWLADRKEYYTSIWREQRLPQYGVRERAPLEQPVFVPVARDGSVFHPGLTRGAGFTIGPKGEEIRVDQFDEALRQLQAMPSPYWRRPNDAGAWGVVAGVRWARLDRSDLEIFAANPQHRLQGQ